MADKTGIEWTDATWNPIVGCSIVSPGCTNCYAMKMAARIEAMQPASHYAGTTKGSKAGAVWTGKLVQAPDSILTQPFRWKKPRKIFVNSMGDLFHEDVPDEWIDLVFRVMAIAKQHTFQVLTKRSSRMRKYLCDEGAAARIRYKGNAAWSRTAARPNVWPLPNVWLGVSAEDQARADERIPDLLATPAAMRFVSAEPLLGPIDFGAIVREALFSGKLSGDGKTHPLGWIIVGGENGPGARPMHPDWVRSIRDQCAGAAVAFFFKQIGEWGGGAVHMSTNHPVIRQFKDFQTWVNKAPTWVNGGTCLDTKGRILRNGADFMRARDEGSFPVAVLHKVGKKRAGRLLDGVEYNGLPEARP